MSLQDILGPDLRVVIVGTIAAWHRAEHEHYYAGSGNNFWLLLHESGLTPERLTPAEEHRLRDFGIGLTDLVRTERSEPGEPPRFDVAGLHRTLRAAAPPAVAFVSKTAAASYARATRQRLPRDYGELPWTVDGTPAFVLPGPSGANNGMPLPLRIALWRDLGDFLAAGALRIGER
ncbi:MAG TPA: mismatch-specific DNA-glycosylase [Jatrophihabitans sp.]|uniref:mismatch-specific DNA-glycosylase n=1 Tax=Jatrophihabitans sp. TaxID=1932789 RepID=UPI002DFC007A|nr:mismatch-specific DNA-glycosylase [Jatrophihabitans sp.]